MINVKHFMDTIEPTDGSRIWVEPIRLTKDLTEWCQVTYTLCCVAPALQRLVCEARREQITLLHQSSDPQQNSATALHEFLIDLEAYCSRDG